MGIINLTLGASEVRADLYPDDILGDKVDSNGVHKVIDVDRSIPTEGVLTVYTESMSKLVDVYSALEGVTREIFQADYTASSKTKISLYLEFKEYNDSEDIEEDSRLLINPFMVELDSQTVEAKLQTFRFIEKHVNRNHIINDWKHIPVVLDQNMFNRFNQSVLLASLYLECTHLSAAGRSSRRLCGQAQIKMDAVLTAQTQEGFKASYGLVNEMRDVVGYINCTLNYTRGRFERGDDIIQELKQDIIQKTQDFKNLFVTIRLTELIILRKASKDFRKISAGAKQELKPRSLTIKVSFGKSVVRSMNLRIPETADLLFKLVLDGHETAEECSLDIDLGKLEEHVLDRSLLEKFFNSKMSAEAFLAVPALIISVTSNDDDDTVIGTFELPLGELILSKVKDEWTGLASFKAYIPLSKRIGKGMVSEDACPTRIGFDMIIYDRDKIKNKNTFSDLQAIARHPAIKSLEGMKSKLSSMDERLVSTAEGEQGVDSLAFTRLLKSLFGLAHTEMSEVVNLIGFLPSNEVNIYKLVSYPLFPKFKAGLVESSMSRVDVNDVLKVDRG